MSDWQPIPEPPYWRWDKDAPNPGRDPAVTMILPTLYPPAADVPPRVDDWCEDRAPDELTDDDGRD